MPSFVMEMAISVGPDQTAPLRMSFDQGLLSLVRPVRLNTCLGLGWLHAKLLSFFLLLLFFCCCFFSFSLVCISRTPV